MINPSEKNHAAYPSVIAIDGPAASGKTTVGTLLAEKLGYLCLDTGVMYRAVALQALLEGVPVCDEESVTKLAESLAIDVLPASKQDGRPFDVMINGVDQTWKIRTEDVNSNVSEVSVYAGVRLAMTEKQRIIARHGKIIMLGRDIGTVVLPDADLKIYLDAAVEVRARRRYEEELKLGKTVKYDDVLASLKHRDKLDSGRTVAPLKPAEDSLIINTDHLSVFEVVENILELIDNSAD